MSTYTHYCKSNSVTFRGRERLLDNRSWGPQHPRVNGQVTQTAVKETDLASVGCCPQLHLHSCLQLAPYVRPTPNKDQQIFKTEIIEPHAHARVVHPLSIVTESAAQSNEVRSKGIRFGKEEAKLSLFAVDMILHTGKQNLHQKNPKLQNKDLSTDEISVKIPGTRSACKN